MPLAPGERVGPYQVLSRLGSGGMGDVYLARDPRLDRRVALKVLRARPDADRADRGRLLHEGRAAARIAHPHIAAIYDVLDTGEHPVLVMEYVEGRTLRREMESRPLTMARAVDVATQICDALASAHAQGVVHGDIKPENVCLTAGGQVKVLDFGIARLAPRPGGGDTQTLTAEGAIPRAFAGTPRYAAPELFGGASPDAQTDVYAAAAVLFEMLAGRPPHAGDNAFDIGLKALAAEAPRVDALRPQVPPTLADAVSRALARERRARTPSAAALATELRAVTMPREDAGDQPTFTDAGLVEALAGSAAADPPAQNLSPGRTARIDTHRTATAWFSAHRLVAVFLVLLAILAWAGWRWAQPRGGDAASQLPVVAVLPLEAIGDDARSAALGTGIADTLIADLANAPGLVVVSRRASMTLPRGRGDVARVARDLGATLLVDGTVQTLGDSLRVSLTLVRPDGAVSWGQSAEGRITEVFDIQRRLAGGLRSALQVDETAANGTLAADRAGRPQGPASLDIQALADYAEALERLARPDLAGNIGLAIDGFTRALGRDPGFALAHVGLADAYMADYRLTRNDASLERAAAHADRAASMAPYHAESWVSLARIRKGTGRYAEAEEALDRALSLQPAYDEAWRELGTVRAERANRAGAEEAFRRAIALRPAFWQNHHEFGRFLFEIGQHEAAAEEFTRVIALQPDSPRGYQALGTVLQTQGRLAAAIENYQRATQLSPSVNAHLNIGVLQHWDGRYREAITSYERAAALAPDDPAPPRNIGDSLLKLGDEPGARAAYTRALALVERELRRNERAGEARELRAVLLAKLGRHEEAAREAGALVSASPDSPSAYHAQAVVAALGGRAGDARAALDRAVTLGYSRELASRDDDLALVTKRPAGAGGGGG